MNDTTKLASCDRLRLGDVRISNSVGCNVRTLGFRRLTSPFLGEEKTTTSKGSEPVEEQFMKLSDPF